VWFLFPFRVVFSVFLQTRPRKEANAIFEGNGSLDFNLVDRLLKLRMLEVKNQIITTAGGRRRIPYNLVCKFFLPAREPLRLWTLNPLERSRYIFFRRLNETKRNLFVVVVVFLLFIVYLTITCCCTTYSGESAGR
jgi:hypothetical protein